jgi:hypothetical protein
MSASRPTSPSALGGARLTIPVLPDAKPINPSTTKTAPATINEMGIL